MRTIFKGGPYQGVVLHLKDGLSFVALPITITIPLAEGTEFHAHAEYRYVHKSDDKRSDIFEFVRIKD